MVVGCGAFGCTPLSGSCARRDCAMLAPCRSALLDAALLGLFRLALALALALTVAGCGGAGGGQSSPSGSPVSVDTDSDGIPDATDADDDNDGFADEIDPHPLDPGRGPEPVSIPDSALHDAVLEKLGKGPGAEVYRHEMAGFGELLVDGYGIASLEGIQFAKALRTLFVGQNPVSDLTPLSDLPELANLDIDSTQVRDFTPLWNLPKLRTLSVRDNNIADLAWLSGLTELTHLSIGDNNISDLSPLSGLSNLSYLYIWDNQISDLAPLGKLASLRSLDLARNRIADPTPLSNLSGLTRLVLSRNVALADIAPLSSLTSLKELQLDNLPRLRDLEPLSSLAQLQELSLSFTFQMTQRPRDLAPIRLLENLVRLNLFNNNLSDVEPLAGLPALEWLGLLKNQVSDISALAKLPSINTLVLGDNYISDLLPLVDNPALDEGDDLSVGRNPLNGTSIDSHIPALRDRGVEVSFDTPALRVSDGPRIHKDNLLVLPVSDDVTTSLGLSIPEVARRFYDHFEDFFDFLMVIRAGERIVNRYSIYSVSNDVQGIGRPEFVSSTDYGSAGRLKAVFDFPATGSTFYNGPALNAVTQQWANYIVEPSLHWGFTSAYGQLGGFRAERLADLGGGRYSAGDFNPIDNDVPYSPIELYLAGFIPPDEVPELLVAEDAEYLYENGRQAFSDGGYPIFTASRIARFSVEDIIAEHGVRAPDHTQSQRAFRAAAILLIDQANPAYTSRLDELSEEVAWFSLAEERDPQNYFYNFYQATGGRATMAMGGLSEFNTGIPVPSTPVRISARSARARDVQDAPDEPRPSRLFQELEGSPRWSQVPEGHSGPAGSHPVWCRHESHGHARVLGPLPMHRSR